MATLLEDYMRDDPVANALRSCAPPPPPILPMNTSHIKETRNPLTRSFSDLVSKHWQSATSGPTRPHPKEKRPFISTNRYLHEEPEPLYGLGINEEAWARLGKDSGLHTRSSSDSCIRKRQNTSGAEVGHWDDDFVSMPKRASSPTSSFSSLNETPYFGAQTPRSASTNHLGLQTLSSCKNDDVHIVTVDGDHIPFEYRHGKALRESPPSTPRSLHSAEPRRPPMGTFSDWSWSYKSGQDGASNVNDSQMNATALTLGLASRLMKLVEVVKDNVAIITPGSGDIEGGDSRHLD